MTFVFERISEPDAANRSAAETGAHPAPAPGSRRNRQIDALEYKQTLRAEWEF